MSTTPTPPCRLSLAHVSQGWGILVPSTTAAPPLDALMPTPPPRIPLRAGVGSFGLTTTAVQTMSHVGSSLLPLPWVTHNDDGRPHRLFVVSSASVCTHDNNNKPHRLVVGLSASVCTHDDNDKPTWLV